MSGKKPRIVVLLRRLLSAPNTVDDDEVLGRCERAALSAALTLGAELEGEVDAIALGPAKREDRVLAMALRAGCDHASRVWDPALASLDYLAVAEVLAATIALRGFDLVLCGHRSQDERQGAIGPAVAHFLDTPHVTGLVDVRAGDDGTVTVLRRASGVLHELSCALPAVLGVVSFSMARQAADREYTGPRGGAIDVLHLGDLDLEPRALAHRRKFVGSSRATRPGANATVVKNPAELVRRLTADRVLR